MGIMKQSNMVPFLQPNGRHTPLSILTTDRHFVGGITIPYGDRTFTYKRNNIRQWEIKDITENAPTAQIAANINWERLAETEFLDELLESQEAFDVWIFHNPCGDITNLAGADGLFYLNQVKPSQLTVTDLIDGPNQGNSNIQSQATGSAEAALFWALSLQHSALTSGVANGITGIAALTEPQADCYEGYIGPNKVFFATTDGGDVIVSKDGGSTWVTAAQPFAGDGAIAPTVGIISNTAGRIIVGDTNATAAQRVAYGDFSLGAEETITWTIVQLDATLGSVEAGAWVSSTDILYGSGGNIYQSTDFGETFTQRYTGSNAFNQIIKDINDNVWAVGASGTILRRAKGSTVFTVKNGPTGNPDIQSVAAAGDGETVYIGAGNTLRLSLNQARTAAGWTTKKTLGANEVVKGIRLGAHKTTELLRLIVDDTTATTGAVYQSYDGGNSVLSVFSGITGGYLGCLFLPPENKLMVGGRSGAIGIVAPG